jgi:hypothetical protein
MERARRNIIKTMLYISVAHTLCWSLNQVIYVAVMVSNIYVDYNGPLYNMSVIIIYINCCINPIVFLTCYKAFKQDLIKRFCPSIKISPNSVAEFKSTTLA